MKYHTLFLLSILLLFLAGCQNTSQVCPPTEGTPEYLVVPPDELASLLPANRPGQIEIGWQTLQVDKIVEGPLCNDTWSGTVYVGCSVQVYPWEDKQPTFLKNCDLNIAPGTTVYVAYHNNAAFYNGCSCHTGATPDP